MCGIVLRLILACQHEIRVAPTKYSVSISRVALLEVTYQCATERTIGMRVAEQTPDVRSLSTLSSW